MPIQQEIPQEPKSILKDDQNTEVSNEEIIDLVDEIIQQVENALKPDTPAEPNIPEPVGSVTNNEQDSEIKDPSKSVPPEKPPTGLIKTKEIQNSPTDVTPNRLINPASPGPNETTWLETLASLKDNYIFKGLLGKGGFGQVYHLCHKLTKQEVAAKVVLSNKVTVSETDSWPNLQHPNILTLMEQHQFGEYHIFISAKQETRLQDIRYTAPFKDIKQYMLDALSGLEYLHHLGMCHLDIKADNILIGKHGAVLCDFGFVAQSKGLINRLFPANILQATGGFHLKWNHGQNHGRKGRRPLGIWRNAVRNLHARSPLVKSKVQGKNWKKTTYPILKKNIKKKNFKNCFKENFPDVDKNTCRAALDIIHAFLHSCPHNRLSAKKAQNHPFFKDPVPKYFVPYPKDFLLW
ncbi:hypothetical protein JTE90_023884 [Oedothorax gibbosus]|uniref:Protein kinase domain-containing protein n=1 Tax=Oedothorax gibbosus TaxID=931172 RepID=A0AAV6ULY0_9ARAC|nr:hypothetical protein JTE90_023884 [Oedothorax gibbosus]